MQTTPNTETSKIQPHFESDRGYYTMKEVCALTRFSRTHIYRLEAAGRFPRRRKLGLAKIGFLKVEVHAWLDNLPKAPLAVEDLS